MRSGDNSCDCIEDAMNLLGDYLAGKAPGTLVKRANSIAKR